MNYERYNKKPESHLTFIAITQDGGGRLIYSLFPVFNFSTPFSLWNVAKIQMGKLLKYKSESVCRFWIIFFYLYFIRYAFRVSAVMEIFVAVPIFLFSTLIVIPIALYFCWRYIPYSRSINKKKRKRMAEEMNNVFYIVHDKDCNCEEGVLCFLPRTYQEINEYLLWMVNRWFQLILVSQSELSCA